VRTGAPPQAQVQRGVREQQSLVLLPGLLCDEALWQPQVASLPEGCEPWIADLTQDDSISAMAQRVLRDAPAQRFALAGLSMGGYVAMEIVRQAPDRVTRLALLDTRARLDTPEETARRMELIRIAQNERGFTPITNRMLPLLVHPSRLQDGPLVEIVRGMAERTGVEAYVRQQQAVMSRPNAAQSLPHVQCPVLVLCGRYDLITPLPMSLEMVALIADARLAVIEACGHLATLEKPNEVNAALRAWLHAEALAR